MIIPHGGKILILSPEKKARKIELGKDIFFYTKRIMTILDTDILARKYDLQSISTSRYANQYFE